MLQENLMTGDSFQRARHAFFGTEKTTPTLSGPLAEFLQGRNMPFAEKVTNRFPKRGRGNLVGRASSQAVHAVDPLQDPRWSTLIAEHPHASVFHTPGWLEALRRTYGFRPEAYTTSASTGALKDALLFVSIRSWLTGRRIVSLPFSDHCAPLFSSAEALTSVLGQVI